MIRCSEILINSVFSVQLWLVTGTYPPLNTALLRLAQGTYPPLKKEMLWLVPGTYPPLNTTLVHHLLTCIVDSPIKFLSELSHRLAKMALYFDTACFRKFRLQEKSEI